ncbi:hypothetical protein GTV32_10425 [Gordonia sp. SID5947]|uniref:hypothetical protein n=1 Tax=Gordonia sp. SID5947 TaxID=2690315 RepID=UPI0013AB3403|nr:hypothetical protein [Gordonia sp. SID5947]MYR06697.1 hypothetical protein [Gordonia sp. SID5947]
MAQHPSAERDFDPSTGSAASGLRSSTSAGSVASGLGFGAGAGSVASGLRSSTSAGSTASFSPVTDDEQAAAAHRRQILSYLGFTLALIALLIILLLSM